MEHDHRGSRYLTCEACKDDDLLRDHAASMYEALRLIAESEDDRWLMHRLARTQLGYIEEARRALGGES